MSTPNTRTETLSAGPIRTLYFIAKHDKGCGKRGRAQLFSVVLGRTGPSLSRGDQESYRRFHRAVTASLTAAAQDRQRYLDAWRERVATTVGYAGTGSGQTALTFAVRVVDASAHLGERNCSSKSKSLSVADHQAFTASRELDSAVRDAWPLANRVDERNAKALTESLATSGLCC